MLTKKDFKAVAEIIRKEVPYCRIQGYALQGITQGDNARIGTCSWIAQNLANYFATQNPRFDRERFMKACGLG
jgi:hypothetical protein